MDHTTDMRLFDVEMGNEAQAQQLVMISRTEQMDILYLKHGLRQSDFLRAISEHDLNNDPQVVQLVQENTEKKQELIAKLEKKMADKMAEEALEEQAKEDKEIKKAMQKTQPGATNTEPSADVIEPSEEVKVEFNESREAAEEAKKIADESR